MTKREVLLAICDTPGWQPASPGDERQVQTLLREGLVTSRLDGYEASALALDNYPRFDSFRDAGVADPSPAPEPGLSVPIDRVVVILAVLLVEMPFPKVSALLRLRGGNFDEDTRQLAQTLAESLCG